MIELRHVSKEFARGTQAVSDVSFTAANGEFLAVIGESGSGKTTILNMINRLVEPSAGQIFIAGKAIDSTDAVNLRRQIGFVFQEIGLFPHLTVAENIAITPRLLGWPPADIEKRTGELLALVRLDRDDIGSRMPAQLSGGQQQRVGLARALAARPHIMLMDEPFGALDPLIRDELAADYRAIHEALGLTTLMVTHDMTEALMLADRIAVMRDGKLLQIGTAQELAAKSADDFVRRMIDMPRRRAKQLADALRAADST
jgi:osmoprotectant transport system ATP-binding protein